MGRYRVWLLLILANLFWAGNYVLGKYIVAEITPLCTTFFRWLLASLILFVIAIFYEKPVWRSILKELPVLAGMGVIGIAGNNLAIYYALNYTSSLNAALVSGLNPGVMAIFSMVFLREKITRIQALGITASLLGVFTVLTQGHLGQILHAQYNRGDLLMLGAVVMWVLYSILGKRLEEVPTITATAVSAFAAVLFMAPFAMGQGFNITGTSHLAVIGIIGIAIFPSVCAFIFWNNSVKEIGAGRSGIFLNLVPVFTAVISWMLGEKITLSQVVGGLIVFVGVYLTTGVMSNSSEPDQNQKVLEKL